MTTITINTRDHGAIEFSIQKEGGYVRANGLQIGDSGYMGSMLTATSGTLEKVARSWHRKHLRELAEFGGKY